MAFFNFPHTRTYDMDLGWLIAEVNRVKELLNQYLENAVITFADPITWNITEQYTALTMVVDSDGTAYLSKQPVPAGIAISNTDYWLPVFNYDDNINTLRSQIAYNAGSSATTGAELQPNDLVFWNGLIYRVITAMPAGTAFIINSNIEKYTVDEKISNIAGTIAQISADITALNEDLQEETQTRINEDRLLQDNIDLFNNMEPVNVLTLGCKNDGSEDCSQIINANTEKPLYFPAGTYRIDQTLNLKHSIKGEGFNRAWKPDHFDGTILNFTMTDGSPAISYSGDLNERSIDIGNLSLQLDPQNTGDGITLNTNNNLFYIHDLHIVGANKRAIFANPSVLSSRYLFTFNVVIWGVYANPSVDSVGIETNANAIDCRFVNTSIQGVHIGMILRGNVATIETAHIWSSARVASEDYWRTSICFDIYAQHITIANTFMDTYHSLIHCGPNGKLTSITDCYAYWDSWDHTDPPTFFSLAQENSISSILNFIIQCPFSLFYISNRVTSLPDGISINGYGNYTTFNFGRSVKCMSYYRFPIEIPTESYIEVARMGKFTSAVINCDLWTHLISTTASEVKYSKIGTGLNVFYKLDGDYFKIYLQCPAGTRPITCKPLTSNVVDKNRNLFNSTSLEYEILSSAADLTAATLVNTLN